MNVSMVPAGLTASGAALVGRGLPTNPVMMERRRLSAPVGSAAPALMMIPAPYFVLIAR